LVLAAFCTWASGSTASACPKCRIAVRDGIFDDNFGSRLGIVVAPFAGMAALGYAAYWTARRKAKEVEDRR
jgi:hypothetical protein